MKETNTPEENNGKSAFEKAIEEAAGKVNNTELKQEKSLPYGKETETYRQAHIRYKEEIAALEKENAELKLSQQPVYSRRQLEQSLHDITEENILLNRQAEERYNREMVVLKENLELKSCWDKVIEEVEGQLKQSKKTTQVIHEVNSHNFWRGHTSAMQTILSLLKPKE